MLLKFTATMNFTETADAMIALEDSILEDFRRVIAEFLNDEVPGASFCWSQDITAVAEDYLVPGEVVVTTSIYFTGSGVPPARSDILLSLKDGLESRLMEPEGLKGLQSVEFGSDGLPWWFKIAIISGTGTVALLLVVAGLAFILSKRRSRRTPSALSRASSYEALAGAAGKSGFSKSCDGSVSTTCPSSAVRQLTEEELNRITTFSTCIGEGSSSRVYAGVLDGKHVAVKVVDVDNNKDTDAQRLSLQSYQSCLNHPETQGLVAVYAKCDSKHAVVMELMEGGSLSKRLAEDNLVWKARVGVLHGVVLALQAMQARTPPAEHRNLKSSNVLLDKQLNCKLSDATGVSAATECKGPGQSEDVNNESDVFLFGMTLLETLTNRRCSL